MKIIAVKVIAVKVTEILGEKVPVLTWSSWNFAGAILSLLLHQKQIFFDQMKKNFENVFLKNYFEFFIDFLLECAIIALKWAKTYYIWLRKTSDFSTIIYYNCTFLIYYI